MKRMTRLRKGLDFLGVLALGGSAGVLAELMLDQTYGWAFTVRPYTELFLVFQSTLLLAVAAFVGARVMQIADIVRRTPVRATRAFERVRHARDLAGAERVETLTLVQDTPSTFPRAA